MQEATNVATAESLTNKLLRAWFRDEPLSPESRAAAAKALDGVDWAAASCSPTTKPLALFLRGALLLLSAAPSPSPAAGADRRRAASLMEAAVKLQPSLADAWVCLGAMHSQAGQLVMALHCLSSGLAAGVSAEGLRQMSMVLRRLAASTGSLPQERAEAAAASLAAAKQAVAMAVTDGFSWYVLGMAHVAAASAAAPTPPAAAAAAAASCDQPPSTHHLKQQQQQECLSDAAATAADVSARAALAAFTAAARAGLSSLPELWFNRAAVALHLGELATALTDFTTAGQLDASLPAAAQLDSITRLLTALAACTGSNSSRSSSSRPAGLQRQQAAALKAALSADTAACLPQQLLPTGFQLVTWRQLQQQQQRSNLKPQQQPSADVDAPTSRHSSKAGRSTSSRRQHSRKSRSSSSSSNSSNSSSNSDGNAGRGRTDGAADAADDGRRCSDQAARNSSSSSVARVALHCRIAAVMEPLPGCAQWVCVGMSSCGGCFPLLLPGSLHLPNLLGACLLLLLGPGCSTAAVPLPAGCGGRAGGEQAASLVMLRVTDAASIIISSSRSSRSGSTTSSILASGMRQQDCDVQP